MDVCLIKKKNLGLSRCVKLPQMPKSMITTPSNFKFTPEETATDEAFKDAVNAALLAGYASRIYLWPLFSGYENATEAPVYEENAYGSQHVRNGRYRFRFQFTQDLCLHTAMFTHRAINNGRVFLLDNEDQLIGTSDSDGNFYGFTINLLNPENLIISDGAVSTKSPVYVVLSNPKELNLNGALISADFLNTIDRLTDVALTLGTPTPTATDIFVKVLQKCDSVPLEGLVAADFKLIKASDGTNQAIVSRTYIGDGVYQLEGVGWVDGTLDLISPATLSVKAYESLGPLTINVP